MRGKAVCLCRGSHWDEQADQNTLMNHSPLSALQRDLGAERQTNKGVGRGAI